MSNTYTSKQLNKYPILHHLTPGTRVYVPSDDYKNLYGEIEEILVGDARESEETKDVEVIVNLEEVPDMHLHYPHLNGTSVGLLNFDITELVYEIRENVYLTSSMQYYISRLATRIDQEDVEAFYKHFDVRVHALGSERLCVEVKDTHVDQKPVRYIIGNYSEPHIYGETNEIELFYTPEDISEDFDSVNQIATLEYSRDPVHVVMQLVALFKEHNPVNHKEVVEIIESHKKHLFPHIHTY